MNPMIQDTHSPPVCERCKLLLPDSEDPLRRSPGPVGRRHSGEFHPPSPVRVSRPGPDGDVLVAYWCSSRCFKAANASPAKKPAKKTGKTTAAQQIHLRPQPSAA